MRLQPLGPEDDPPAPWTLIACALGLMLMAAILFAASRCSQ